MHVIRLRGPWQLEPLVRWTAGANGALTEVPLDVASARATMPTDWSATWGAAYRGIARYTRSFQRPTNLDADERVWLVVEPPRSRGTIRLAGAVLGDVSAGEPAGRFDVTNLLAATNRLEIDVAHPADIDEAAGMQPGGLVGEVRLEIEEAS